MVPSIFIEAINVVDETGDELFPLKVITIDGKSFSVKTELNNFNSFFRIEFTLYINLFLFLK